jgi:hypothetical protein
MRHDPGLAASPPPCYRLRVERTGASPFVDADADAGEFQVHDAGEPDHAGLGSRVAGLAERPEQAHSRGNTATTSSNSAAVIRVSERSRVTPALFTSSPIPPYSATQAWTSRWQNSGPAMEPTQATAATVGLQ